MRIRTFGTLLAVMTTSAVAGSGGVAPAAPREVVVEATVIEAPTHGPRLCASVALSRPPLCGDGIRLERWRWGAVPNEESGGGTTWGEYQIVGTYDGRSFRATEVSRPNRSKSFDDDQFFRTPCDPPAGGWVNRDPARLAIADAAALADVARASPDFVVMWPDRSRYLQTANIAFTGPVDAHREELERIWGGPICVLQYRHSPAVLRATQESITRDAVEGLGFELLATWSDEVHNLVNVTVVAADAQERRQLARRLGGPDLVQVQTWMRPLR